jgi:uncharacterized protein YbjT (DUF2867 family)
MPLNSYFVAKVAQELGIEAAGVPYTIVRATQFMEFIGTIADSCTQGDTVHLGDGLFQPIAADDVAAILTETALGVPLNSVIDIAGPNCAPFAEVVTRYLKSLGDTRSAVTDQSARYFGGRVEHHSLVPLGDALLGHISLEQWLARGQESKGTRELESNVPTPDVSTSAD